MGISYHLFKVISYGDALLFFFLQTKLLRLRRDIVLLLLPPRETVRWWFDVHEAELPRDALQCHVAQQVRAAVYFLNLFRSLYKIHPNLNWTEKSLSKVPMKPPPLRNNSSLGCRNNCNVRILIFRLKALYCIFCTPNFLLNILLECMCRGIYGLKSS